MKPPMFDIYLAIDKRFLFPTKYILSEKEHLLQMVFCLILCKKLRDRITVSNY